DELLSCLDPVGLLRYGRANRENYRLVKDFLRREFILDNLLSPFITSEELPCFRKIHAGSQFLISGSMALQFFTHIQYPDSDLDLYIEEGRSHALILWLESIGYVEREDQSQAQSKEMVTDTGDVVGSPDYSDPCILKVASYTRNSRQVQVICTRNTPLQIILDFPLTCVMNFITATTAYSLYPWATFESKIALEINTVNSELEFNAKYAARGWGIRQGISRDDEKDRKSEFCLLDGDGFTRYVGDHRCWI
ncbi:hypothetical protein BDN72DRAFT_729525, partial [Pluteus cervinus]